MLRRAAMILGCAILASCATGLRPFVPDTARLPPGSFGTNEDPDVAAINFAQYAFADAGRTYGRPAEGARAVASIDYLAGELSTSPRWQNMSALTLQQMLQAREAVRQAVGIAPNAPSQAVVNSLSATYNDLVSGNEQAALAALASPIYLQPPRDTLVRLANLPYIQIANVASQHAASQMFQNDNTQEFPF